MGYKLFTPLWESNVLEVTEIWKMDTSVLHSTRWHSEKLVQTVLKKVHPWMVETHKCLKGHPWDKLCSMLWELTDIKSRETLAKNPKNPLEKHPQQVERFGLSSQKKWMTWRTWTTAMNESSLQNQASCPKRTMLTPRFSGIRDCLKMMEKKKLGQACQAQDNNEQVRWEVQMQLIWDMLSLECCMQIWRATFKRNELKTEQVERRVTRILREQKACLTSSN